MTDPETFPASAARYGLPFLFAGQAQKEVTVNAAHALIDVLLHPAIEGEADSPPADPGAGQCWLVGSAPSGAFIGHESALAAFQAGTWLFAQPRDGLRVFDRSTGQLVAYAGEWRRVAAPPIPQGGATIDQPARDAIATLIESLRTAGIFPAD